MNYKALEDEVVVLEQKIAALRTKNYRLREEIAKLENKILTKKESHIDFALPPAIALARRSQSAKRN